MITGETDIIRPEQDWLVIIGWMGKREILNRIREFAWNGWMRVNKLVGDDEWRKEVADFLMPEDKGNFMAYLHEASIQGYSVRSVAPDGFTGIYLDRRGDMTTNIDLELMEAIDSIKMGWTEYRNVGI